MTERAQPRARRLSLFWPVIAANAALMLIAGIALSLSASGVSPSDVAVLAVTLAAMLIGNAILLRRAVSQMRDRLEAELRESLQDVVAGQEAERRRLAGELHGGISQNLTALLLQLGRSAKDAPEGLSAELASAEQAARASLEEVRRIIRDLRPEALDDLGLASALAILGDRVFEQTGLRVRRAFDHSCLTAMSPEEELVVYRVAEESLTNVVRHAGASEALLALERAPAGLTLRVRDDGRGLNGGLSEGKGIRDMRARATLIGAEFSLESPASGGFEVRLTLPAGETGR